jgi:hypothetical protein
VVSTHFLILIADREIVEKILLQETESTSKCMVSRPNSHLINLLPDTPISPPTTNPVFYGIITCKPFPFFQKLQEVHYESITSSRIPSALSPGQLPKNTVKTGEFVPLNTK